MLYIFIHNFYYIYIFLESDLFIFIFNFFLFVFLSYIFSVICMFNLDSLVFANFMLVFNYSYSTHPSTHFFYFCFSHFATTSEKQNIFVVFVTLCDIHFEAVTNGYCFHFFLCNCYRK